MIGDDGRAVAFQIVRRFHQEGMTAKGGNSEEIHFTYTAAFDGPVPFASALAIFLLLYAVLTARVPYPIARCL